MAAKVNWLCQSPPQPIKNQNATWFSISLSFSASCFCRNGTCVATLDLPGLCTMQAQRLFGLLVSSLKLRGELLNLRMVMRRQTAQPNLIRLVYYIFHRLSWAVPFSIHSQQWPSARNPTCSSAAAARCSATLNFSALRLASHRSVASASGQFI